MRHLANPSRLRILQRPLRSLPQHGVRDPLFSRSYGQAVHSHRTVDPYIHLPLPSSFIATSSRVTLDDFPPIRHDFSDGARLFDGFEDDSLDHATDEDLMSAIVLPSVAAGSPSWGQPRKGKEKQTSLASNLGLARWEGSIDPGRAFEALRRRPSYSSFLNQILPHFTTIWHNLKAAGVCSDLVADLLLRFPDARLLHQVLNLDANGDVPVLSSSEQVLIFKQVQPLIRAHRLLPLIRRAYIRLSMACRMEDEAVLLELVYDALVSKTPRPRKEDILQYSFILAYLSERGHDSAASRLLDDMLEHDYLSHRLLAHRGGEHPLADKLLIHAVIMDTILGMGYTTRAMKIAKMLVDWLRGSFYQKPAYDGLLEVCRALLIGKPTDRSKQRQARESVSWILQQLLRVEEAPPLPAAIFDLILQSTPYLKSTDPLVRIYILLPPGSRPVLSAASIGRLVTLNLKPEILLALCEDIRHLPQYDFVPHYRTMLLALARARCWSMCKDLYRQWRGQFFLDSTLVLSIVRCARKEIEQVRSDKGGVIPKTLKYVATESQRTTVAAEERRQAGSDQVDPFALEVLAEFAYQDQLSLEDRFAIALAFTTLRLGDSAVRVLRSLESTNHTSVLPTMTGENDGDRTQDSSSVDLNKALAESREKFGRPIQSPDTQVPPRIASPIGNAILEHMDRAPGMTTVLLLLARAYGLQSLPKPQTVFSSLCLSGRLDHLDKFHLAYEEFVLPMDAKLRFESDVLASLREHAVLVLIRDKELDQARHALLKFKKKILLNHTSPEVTSTNNGARQQVDSQRESRLRKITPSAPSQATIRFYLRTAVRAKDWFHALEGLYMLSCSSGSDLNGLKAEASHIRTGAISVDFLKRWKRLLVRRLVVKQPPARLEEKMRFLRDFVGSIRNV